jgi:hypothetical protein
MSTKLIAVFLIAFVFATLSSKTALADDEVHEGKVLSVGTSSITVSDEKDGDNDTFTVDSNTKITMNGKPAKLTDLHAGDRAKVTAIQKGDKLFAKEIAARSPE